MIPDPLVPFGLPCPPDGTVLTSSGVGAWLPTVYSTLSGLCGFSPRPRSEGLDTQ